VIRSGSAADRPVGATDDSQPPVFGSDRPPASPA